MDARVTDSTDPQRMGQAILTQMPLRSALISFGGVMVVNGVVSMTLIYILWNLKII